MTTPAPSRCCPCPPPGRAAGLLLCDCTAPGVCVQFVRIFLDDATVTDVALDGGPYTVAGIAAPCTEDQTDGCDTTTPVAAATLCLPNGTPVVVVVQRDCDGTVSSPGWVALTTGVYTEGPVPAGAAPCDTNTAAAGSAGRLVLCDCDPTGECVGFLRAIAADGTTTDTTITGAPYTPTGTVGVCDALAASTPPCASPTTPMSTTGLCLADGSPIAVTAERDCDGVVVRTGWLNLTTGAWSAGAAPAGTRACGETAAFEVSGVLCDVDPVTGDVLGLVLIQVERGPDGDITGVTLLSAADGSTYVLQGELSVCPAGTAQPEKDLVSLCDVDPSGTVTPFIRDYARDENGAIVGHSDYLLDNTPYVPAGTVGVCPDPEACSQCQSVVLCDSGAASPALITGTAASGTLSNGVTWSALDRNPGPANGTALPPQQSNGDGSWWGLNGFPHATRALTEWTFSGPSTVEFSVYLNFNPDGGTTNDVQLPPGLEVVSLPAGYEYNAATGVLTRTQATGDPCSYVTDPAIATSARFRTPSPVTSLIVDPTPVERIALCGRFFTYLIGAFQVAAAGQLLRTVCRDCDGTVVSVTDTALDGTTPYTVVGDVETCPTNVTESVSINGLVEVVPQVFQHQEVLCDDNGEFIRKYVQDATGAVVAIANLDLAGAPYTPAGTVRSTCDRPIVCYSSVTTTDECQPGVLTTLPTINPTIASAVVEANPNAFTVNGLAASFNGSLSDWATITTNAAGAMPGLVLRYTFAAPADLTAIRLFNQYGGIHTDRDGIGAATLTVFDNAANVLWTGPMAAGNGGAPWVTSFGGVLQDAASFTLTNLTRNALFNGTTIGFRDLDAVGPYRAQIVWDCPNETITAAVEGAAAGITYDGLNLTQTNGPHTFTFSSNLGAFGATIETDNPAAWSTTALSDTSPTTVLSGNGTLTTSVIPSLVSGIAVGWLNADGTVTDINTGDIVADATVVPCVAPREPDHVVTADMIEMCDAGTGFLRQVRLTRDGDVQITDTDLDGRDPYTVTDEAMVVTGPCVRERLADACAEMGPLLQPVLVGFTPQADCLVTTAANPTATWTGDIQSIEFTEDAGLVGGSAFRLVLNGVTTVLSTAFVPAIPAAPGSVSDYVGTATVGGILITAEQFSGGLARNGTAFGLAGRMRFTFSPNVDSVQIQTAAWANSAANTICDAVALPATVSNPEPLAVYRNADGTVTYYTVDGTVVTDPILLPCGSCCGAETGPCDTPLTLGEVCYSPPVTVPDAPLAVTNLVMTGSAFNDAAGEDLCNIVPAPTSETGWTIVGACRNPTVGNPSLTWAGPIQTVAMEYGDATSANADGGVFVAFSSTETGAITWPTNNTPMTLGETRASNLLAGGRFARLTYVSGPANANAPRQAGGANIGVHFANVSNDLPVRFRLDLFGPGSIATDEDFARAAVTRECDGTTVYTDLLTGQVLDPATISRGPCPVAEPAGATLRARARRVAPADAAWSPANDVTGFATSVTASGIAGTWTVTDANGTVLAGLPSGLHLSWSAGDDNDLSAPQAIDAEAGGLVVVNWTER